MYNTLHLQDNMRILSILPQEWCDCIFCDILYGTGVDFKDYQDIQPHKNVIYDFYAKRIQHMHRILKSTGSIFLMCDWHINHWIRDMLDTIFGYHQFRNEIVWYYPDTLKSSKATKFPRNHDTILFYAKSQHAKYVPIRIPREEMIRRGKKFHDPATKRCLYERDAQGKIQYVDYVDVLLDDVWILGKTGVNSPMSKEFLPYATQKPIEIPKRCIQATTEEGDVVADFFMGSGTTIEAAILLNRKYIGVDNQQKAFSMTQERILTLPNRDTFSNTISPTYNTDACTQYACDLLF